MNGDLLYHHLVGSDISKLTDPPGVFYALAYCFAAFLIAAMYRVRKSAAVTVISSLLLLTFLGVVMTASRGSRGVLFFVCMFSYFLAICLYIHVLCGWDWAKTVYTAFRAFMAGELMASVYWQLYFYSVKVLGVNQGLLTALIYMLLIYVPVLTGMYVAEDRNRSATEAFRPTAWQLVTTVLAALIVYGFSNMSYVLKNTPFSTSLTQEIFIIHTLTDIGGVMILYSFHLANLERDVRVEKELLEQTLRMQYDNYCVSEESVAIVNQKYHDLKHQLAILKSEATRDDKLKQIESMEDEIRQFEARSQTGCKYLDTILTAKSLQCQNEEIVFTAVADGEELSFMDPMDIAALFGNALDNAIESVRKIQDRDRRVIYLNVSRQKSFLRIKVENRYDGEEIRLSGGLPVTTKADKRYHGFGTRSIRSITEKYDGSMNIDTSGGWYRLQLLIPLEI